ncbi:hypothetical protein YC2023_006995 [Brassica napus]
MSQVADRTTPGYQHVRDFPKFGIQTIFGAQLQSLLRNLAAVCCKQSKTMFGQPSFSDHVLLNSKHSQE